MSKAASTDGDRPQTYEQARAELETVVHRLEAGGVPLEESLALWERGEELARPDASFHDDHVGGRLKSEEAARKRAVTDRFTQQQPRRIARETERIAEAGAFRPTHEDEAQRRARAQLGREASRARRRSAGVAGRPRRRVRRRHCVDLRRTGVGAMVAG